MRQTTGYRKISAIWQADPEGFWANSAQGIVWAWPPTRALNDTRAPMFEGFAAAQVNTCWNAVDHPVRAGRGAQAAIIHDSRVSGTKHVITCGELQDRFARLAGALSAMGVKKRATASSSPCPWSPRL